MGRKIEEKVLRSKQARASLEPRSKPYYRELDHGAHLGYRRGPGSGRWLVRVYLGKGQYRLETIANADDTNQADGRSVLDYSQAIAAAQQRATQMRLDMSGGRTGKYRVRDAAAEYLAYLEDNRRESTHYDAKMRFESQILDELGDIECSKLTTDQLRKWISDLLHQKPKPHSLRGTDEEMTRRRKATVNRIVTTLKSSLNRAYNEGRISNKSAWERIKPFDDVGGSRPLILSNEELTRLINTANQDMRDLIRGAIVTGARYGELTALKVRDFDSASASIYFAAHITKTNKARTTFLTDEGAQVFADLCTGRDADEPIFLREDGAAWGKSHQMRPFSASADRAKLPEGATFYTLRHTYITNSIQTGIPIKLIADNVGNSIKMIELHYEHVANTFKADIFRKSGYTFGLEQPIPKVVSIR